MSNADFNEQQFEREKAKAVADERKRWALWVRAMHRADDAYGSGFYNQPEWLAAYQELRRMAGMGEKPNV